MASGEARAKISSWPEPSSSSKSGSVMRSSSAPVMTGESRLPMPTWAAIAAAVSGWSPVTTMTRIPAV